MEFFEHDFPENEAIVKGNPKKWLLDKPFKLNRKKKITAFTKEDYLSNPSAYRKFKQLSGEFVCANPDCGSTGVHCIWYHFNGIDLNEDETFAEFYCPDCRKYTFVEYYRSPI